MSRLGYQNTIPDRILTQSATTPGRSTPLSFTDGIGGGLPGTIVNSRIQDKGYLQWLA
jgi:hypothetical protein